MALMFKPTSGKLSETRNIIELWEHAVGESEVPMAWHRWSCISTIAAAVRDNVWYQKFKHERLCPNMYVFLIGPSGVGKGIAIGFAQQFRHPAMNVINGTATHKALIDLMAMEPTEERPEPNKMWLIHTELANDVGDGPLATAFVKAMTDWYNPSSTPFTEGTRKHGYNEISPPVLNWLAGTTVNWLGQTVDAAALNSGFFGRVCAAPGKFDPRIRVYDPSEHSPEDYFEVIGHIYDRIDDITKAEGCFHLDHVAREMDREWYAKRPDPEPGMEPFWRREQDLRYKIAMCLSLCDDLSLVIKPVHLTTAGAFVQSSAQAMPGIIHTATANETLNTRERIFNIIRTSGDRGIDRSALTKKVYRFCSGKKELDSYIDSLEAADKIMKARKGNKMSYHLKRNIRSFT